MSRQYGARLQNYSTAVAEQKHKPLRTGTSSYSDQARLQLHLLVGVPSSENVQIGFVSRKLSRMRKTLNPWLIEVCGRDQLALFSAFLKPSWSTVSFWRRTELVLGSTFKGRPQ